MRFFYDFEFVDNGITVEPLSVGMVAEDGGELYLVRDLGDWTHRTGNYNYTLLEQVKRNPWLVEHVLPELLRAQGTGALVSCPRVMGERILAFVREHADFSDRPATRDDVELWGYFPAYDHVCLAQLFGSMIKLPEPVPMFTMDVRQEMVRDKIGLDSLPPQVNTHHALFDAHWNRAALTAIEFRREYSEMAS